MATPLRVGSETRGGSEGSRVPGNPLSFTDGAWNPLGQSGVAVCWDLCSLDHLIHGQEALHAVVALYTNHWVREHEKCLHCSETEEYAMTFFTRVSVNNLDIFQNIFILVPKFVFFENHPFQTLIYTFILVKKNLHKIERPLTAGGGVEALADASDRSASFFYVSSLSTRPPQAVTRENFAHFRTLP